MTHPPIQDFDTYLDQVPLDNSVLPRTQAAYTHFAIIHNQLKRMPDTHLLFVKFFSLWNPAIYKAYCTDEGFVFLVDLAASQIPSFALQDQQNLRWIAAS